MAIPARDIRGVVALHGIVPDYEVFKNLIKARTDVEVARGIRWTIVEDIPGTASLILTNLPV